MQDKKLLADKIDRALFALRPVPSRGQAAVRPDGCRCTAWLGHGAGSVGCVDRITTCSCKVATWKPTTHKCLNADLADKWITVVNSDAVIVRWRWLTLVAMSEQR